jgi:hypothetical protein
VLARAALRALPTDRADQAPEVARRHQLARATLGQIEGDLWSTEARGFRGRSAIERDISVLEVK